MVQKGGMQPDQPEDENITIENEETKNQIGGISHASDSQEMIEGK